MEIAALVSGGVDSSVVVHQLKEAGYDPTIFYIRIGMEDKDGYIDCPAEEDIEITSYIAKKYGCRFEIVSLHDEYWDRVVSYTIDSVKRGLTPNPDMMCNKYIKFGCFEEKWGKDFDKIATGHYATTTEIDGKVWLSTAKDPVKDQTDFLGQITRLQIQKLMFPIGHLMKSEVRAIAEQHHFINARKHDSQDICFVPDGDYARFMEGFTGKRYPAGDFLDESGKVVGTHNGAVRYTLGQRKGLGLALGAPVYVCGKDMQANTVTVGPESALFDRIVYAEDVNWIAIPELTGPLRVTARTRYHQTEQAATVYPAENGFRLEFDQPQRAPTPGQSVVLYQGDVVLGGGIITRVEK